MKMLSIWSTFEMDCAARSFSYEQYCDMHKQYKLGGLPLSKKGYNRVNQIITEAIEDDWNKYRQEQKDQNEEFADEFK